MQGGATGAAGIQLRHLTEERDAALASASAARATASAAEAVSAAMLRSLEKELELAKGESAALAARYAALEQQLDGNDGMLAERLQEEIEELREQFDEEREELVAAREEAESARLELETQV